MKVIDKLSLIKVTEWKDFEKFVSSPYFNKGRNYIPLLNILKEFYPDFDSRDLTAEYIYKRLHKGKEFNLNVMNTILSGLSNICEEFFFESEFQEK